MSSVNSQYKWFEREPDATAEEWQQAVVAGEGIGKWIIGESSLSRLMRLDAEEGTKKDVPKKRKTKKQITMEKEARLESELLRKSEELQQRIADAIAVLNGEKCAYSTKEIDEMTGEY